MYKSENEDELWDLFDEDRCLTGKKQRRGDPMLPGTYHLVIHVCIFNSKNELLIQRRQPWKKGWPGMWDLTVAGSAVAGDDSRRAAEREVLEEIGLEIKLGKTRPHFTICAENAYDDYYMIKQDVDIKELKLQESEVSEVKWINKSELLAMIEKKEIIPYFFLEKIFEIKEHYGSRNRYELI